MARQSKPGEAGKSSTPGVGDDKISAIFLNCTLKRSPRVSNTDALIELSRCIMEPEGISVTAIRPVDYTIPPGMKPDMTRHGYDEDDWPELYEQILDHDIVVVCSPIWLGEKSSVCTNLIERMYASSSEQNDKGQYIYYGRVGGCLITGNEDGVKHCCMNIIYSLHHLGFLIPPQADAGWVGEAGPGPSYRDDDSHGPENEFTNQSTARMTWNLIHMARMLRKVGGIPSRGNSVSDWEDGDRFGLPEPEQIKDLQGGPSQK